MLQLQRTALALARAQRTVVVQKRCFTVPSPQDPPSFKKFAKGPIPPILVLTGMAMWMSRDKSWDGSPKMQSVTVKIFGANGPF
mmetsp:Transcript_114203/g.271840  ORF Transcript_114203/g.271840 Transcript_114203/m.271840 type:complete len:84 (-) Transcript_114203:85-336(-)